MEEEISVLKREIEKLKHEISDQDLKFSEKRAQFKNLYVTKEEELNTINSKYLQIQRENDNLKKELKDTQSAAAMAESFREEELRLMTSKYNEETTKLNKLMRENLKAINKRVEEKDKKIQMLQSEKTDLVSRLEEKSLEISEATKNALSKIANKFKINAQEVFRNNIEGTEQSETSAESDDLNLLKNLVEPYEEDVRMLKDKIREAYSKIDYLESQNKKLQNIESLEKELSEIKDKLNIEKANNDFMDKCLQQATEKNFKTQNRLDMFQNILPTILTQTQNNELNKLVALKDNEVTNTITDAMSDSISSIRKSKSGDNICSYTISEDSSIDSINFPNTKFTRRNTDVQSLKDFCGDLQEKCVPTKMNSMSTCADMDDGASCGGGCRTVSEKEWSRMQLELQNYKQKFRKHTQCELCLNYEDQLQTLQEKFQEKEAQLTTATDQLNKQINQIDSLKESNNTILSKINDITANQKGTIDSLTGKISSLTDYSEGLRTRFEEYLENTTKNLKDVQAERQSTKKRLEKIQKLYDHLLQKRSMKSREMDAEKIELPDTIDLAHFELLKYRENIIEYKATNEHLQDQLHSNEVFNKEKADADQLERDALSEEYSKEKKLLDDKIDKLEAELSKYKSTKKASENLEETINCLKSELEIVKKKCSTTESEKTSLKTRLQSLQQELENSESVQKDFVKLSQTLQMQLEELRQEEREIRWQYEEDVKGCMRCSKDFNKLQKEQQAQQSSSAQRKLPSISNSPISLPKQNHLPPQQNLVPIKRHCRHCGKIFCMSCITSIEKQSPVTGQTRQIPVCKVCHTLLVPDAIPYFSTSINKSLM